MNRFIKKIAVAAVSLSLFCSLTAFTTDTTVTADTIAQTHLVELDHAAYHNCGANCRTYVGPWQTGKWRNTGLYSRNRYRVRTVTNRCAICGADLGHWYEGQSQSSLRNGWGEREWNPIDFDASLLFVAGWV